MLCILYNRIVMQFYQKNQILNEWIVHYAHLFLFEHYFQYASFIMFLTLSMRLVSYCRLVMVYWSGSADDKIHSSFMHIVSYSFHILQLDCAAYGNWKLHCCSPDGRTGNFSHAIYGREPEKWHHTCDRAEKHCAIF